MFPLLHTPTSWPHLTLTFTWQCDKKTNIKREAPPTFSSSALNSTPHVFSFSSPLSPTSTFHHFMVSWPQCLLPRPRPCLFSFCPCPPFRHPPSPHSVCVFLSWGKPFSRGCWPASHPSTFPCCASGCCGEAPGEEHLSCSSPLPPLPTSKYQQQRREKHCLIF